ncbi:MAG: ABC transporter substrate-binding protein, partial [Bdellovibrionales bacterium]|nr:ABC transporter substrate-binding protein [Bdellovibrionales bacterium]
MKNLTLTSLLFLLSLISSVCAEADVTIAGIYSITGFGAIGGTSELNAARLAVNEINAAGGIQGHKINFVVEDNQSDLRQTTTAFKKLVAINKPLVLLGPNWSEFSEIVAPLAQSSKTVM